MVYLIWYEVVPLPPRVSREGLLKIIAILEQVN
jgi:hypothetical protein